MKTYPEDWDRAIDRFANAMRTKIAIHADKGDWRHVPVRAILDKLHEELDELKRAVDSGNSVEVTLEAADLAICAMMIDDIMNGSPRPEEMRELEDRK